MTPIVYLPLAEHDLVDIWEYHAAFGFDVADRVIDRIKSATVRLADFPLSGRSRPEFGDGARTVNAARYIFMYRVVRERIEIVRVVHGSRDLDSLFDS